ncbi:EamA family transporter [Dyella choica]|uniref:EamA family transporter n=2 Tax=Dyella choica TaxID=1927959 RepID=A0A3S0PK25_9GAMM|nr:EamA family transporter [Dyella choica]
MLLRAVIQGLSFSIVGLLTIGLPPLLLTALRFAIAAIVLLPLVWRTLGQRPRLRGLALYIVMGLCQAVFFGAMFWAAHRTSALSMAVLSVSVPFLAYCLGIGFGVEPSSMRLLGILALGAGGALGMAWAGNAGGLGGMHLGRVEAVYLVGCLGLALYAVLSRWGLSSHCISARAEVRTFWSLVFGALLVGVLGLATEDLRGLENLTASDALLLAYLGTLSTGGTFWLMQHATPVLTPGSVTSYAYVPPFVSMLLLFMTEPQSISWRWLPGALLVLLAMSLLLRRRAWPPAETCVMASHNPSSSSIRSTGVR